MANPEHLKILKQGVEAWNKWRTENVDIKPDLIEADLTEVILYGANLSKAILYGANLSKTNLERADITYTDLRKANLTEANLCGANLVRTNLNNADLIRTNLSKADLIGANLTEANLRQANQIYTYYKRANLTGADLTYTNLTEVNFTDANLRRAVLTEANLTNAYLIVANLTRANLSKADLKQTKLFETIFVNTNFSKAKNLDLCDHQGPSYLDHHTLIRSDNLPEIFLRGCGLPDSLIEYYPSLLNQPFNFYSCFISYSHADKSFARRLHDALQGKGIRCWLDEHQLLPGQDIHDEVDRGIRLWDKLLLCASKYSLTSWWVDNEINTAFEKEQVLMKERGEKVRVLVPLNLDGYLFKWQDGKANPVKSQVAADFTGWETDNQKFENALERLVKSLQAETEGREPPPISKL